MERTTEMMKLRSAKMPSTANMAGNIKGTLYSEAKAALVENNTALRTRVPKLGMLSGPKERDKNLYMNGKTNKRTKHDISVTISRGKPG